MKYISIQEYTSPVGELIIGSYNNKLCICDWKYRKMRSAIDQRIKKHLDTEFSYQETRIIKDTICQLDDYFNNKRKEFNLPLSLIGTDFQKKVWNSLVSIPYGITSSYMELSKKLGDTKAIRAVATANGANALSIIVPCHRIIGSNGDLVGYAGGLSAKRKLLKLEGAITTTQLELFK